MSDSLHSPSLKEMFMQSFFYFFVVFVCSGELPLNRCVILLICLRLWLVYL